MLGPDNRTEYYQVCKRVCLLCDEQTTIQPVIYNTERSPFWKLISETVSVEVPSELSPSTVLRCIKAKPSIQFRCSTCFAAMNRARTNWMDRRHPRHYFAARRAAFTNECTAVWSQHVRHSVSGRRVGRIIKFDEQPTLQSQRNGKKVDERGNSCAGELYQRLLQPHHSERGPTTGFWSSPGLGRQPRMVLCSKAWQGLRILSLVSIVVLSASSIRTRTSTSTAFGG
jgi:hypothetical protein